MDKWVAREIVRFLNDAGLKVWFDELRIDAGGKIPDDVFEGVKRSRELLVLLTPTSIKSQWVSMEIGAALSRSRRVTPVLYHVAASRIPEMIKDSKGISLDDLTVFAHQVKRRLRPRVRK